MNKKKILVCDYDSGITRILKHLLAKEGFAVSSAANGNRGLALLSSVKPDLLIMELELPLKDGAAMLREMRAAPAKKPYIIVLTAHESKEKHEEAASLGAREIWTKPFNAAELLKKLKTLTQKGAL